jgi:flagellar basal body P-ring formation protein FlgA
MMLAALALAGCLAVDPAADQILLGDLASAFPAAVSLPKDTVIGFAPAPGVERRFETAELRRIGARFNLPEPEREICISRPAAPVDPARIVEALRAALPDARIELLDYSRYPVPEGPLEFATAGLRGALWTGAVRYGGRHRASVWARVQVTIQATRVIATRNLAAGVRIDAADLRIETRDDVPGPEPMLSDPAAIAGMIPRRSIRAGEAIRSSWLAPAKAVARGETVDVEVRAGGALLRLPAEALASGSVGQTILVRNPESNRRFPARIEAPGKVAIGKPSL